LISYFLLILAQENGEATVWDDMRPFLYVAAVVLAALLLMRWTQRRVIQSQQKKRPSVRQLANQTKAGSDIYGQIGELMGQLADMSRQINGQIDTRIKKLEILLRDADQAAAKLEKLTGKDVTDQKSTPTSSSGNGAAAIRKISEDFRQQQAASSEATGPARGEIEGPRSSGEAGGSPASAQKNSRISIENQQILAMDQQGMSAVEIAQELNRPIGEIELILALKGKKSSFDHNDT